MERTLELVCFTLLLNCGAAARPAADSGTATPAPASAADAPRDQGARVVTEPTDEPSAPAPARRRAATGNAPAPSAGADGDGVLECRVDADCAVSAAQQQSCEHRAECAGISAECVEGECRTIERRLHRSDPTLEHAPRRASVPAACAGGASFAQGGAADNDCAVIANGLCFASDAQACACAGCAVSQCSFLESYPPQAVCN